MNRFIYYLTMFRSTRVIIQEYGKEFWYGFKDTSDKLFKLVLKDTPDIGKSVFSFNYAYAPSYVSWYKAMRKQGLSAEQADDLMWKMNERMLLTVPKPLLGMTGKAYLNSFRRKAKTHMERQKNGLHPFDWEIQYQDIDKNSFEINITKCGFIAFAKKFGTEEMLPGICPIRPMGNLK